MYLIENLSNKIGHGMANILKLDKDQEEIIIYGAFNLIQNLWSIFCIIVFGIIFHVIGEALIICFAISLLRKYSGGVHASSPSRCVLIGTIICVGFGLIVKKVFSIFPLTLIVFLGAVSIIVSYYIVYECAPVDSPAKPIKKIETKQRLKRYSTFTLHFFSVIIIILLIFYFKYGVKFLLNSVQCIYVGVIWQSFTLTNKGHKILSKTDKI